MLGRNPHHVPLDTDPLVWRLQMAAIAQRSIASRLDELTELLAEGSRLEAEAVRRRHPEYSDREVFLAVVRSRYGDELTLEVWPDATGVTP